jgi:ferric-dicitrate binding protein FerR (iron transport regulator)
MQTNQIQDLLKRYLAGECTEEEKALVESSYLDFHADGFPLTENEIDGDLAAIAAKLPKEKQPKVFSLFKKMIAAAAVLVIVASVAIYFAIRPKNEFTAKIADPAEKILPGTDKAILTLADGRKIILDKNASTLVLDSLAGIRIKKTAKGELVYEVLDVEKNATNLNAFNTIETPRGSQYKIILPDGSNVWLNASSSLKYPVIFDGKKRNVELTGEAYFEVSKNKEMPFVVHTQTQDVQVLGTHFNINAYPDETETKTTLLEGKVLVSKGAESKMMKPGEQVVNFNQSRILELSTMADAAESIAWKNGLFLFNHNNLYSIMNQISRWYDIEVDYEGDFNKQYYSGTISRFGKVTDVLKTMELTGSVKFKIVGRRIVVMK